MASLQELTRPLATMQAHYKAMLIVRALAASLGSVRSDRLLPILDDIFERLTGSLDTLQKE